MGIPRRIPSGGDGLDKFSEPLPPIVEEPLPASIEAALPSTDNGKLNSPTSTNADPSLDSAKREFEEFQRWKRERESMTAQTPQKAARRASGTSPRTVKGNTSNQQLQQPADGKIEEPESQWLVDRKTGKKYKNLSMTPKEAIAAYRQTKGAGLTLSQMMSMVTVQKDFNIDDLNGTAETFMSHLRVPPSKQEQADILQRKADLVKKQKAERAELDRELNDKEGVLEEPEADPFGEKAPKKRGFFSRIKKNKGA